MNEPYDYETAVYEDVKTYMNEHFAECASGESFEDEDELREWLHDTLWTEDYVTGNGSGSYTFSRYQAEEYICHNIELLGEACEEFGCDMDILKNGAEACDVTIRCYLLDGAIDRVLDEMDIQYPIGSEGD